jgi:hypothetical protein
MSHDQPPRAIANIVSAISSHRSPLPQGQGSPGLQAEREDTKHVDKMKLRAAEVNGPVGSLQVARASYLEGIAERAGRRMNALGSSYR